MRTSIGAAACLGLAATLLLVPASPGLGAESGEGPLPLRRLVVGSTGQPAISVLGVDREGALSPVPGSPFPADVFSLGLAITPDARTVYSTHTVSGTVVGHRISDDGTLSRITGGTIQGHGPAVGVAVSPDGSRLFVTVGMAPVEIRSYDIGPTGALSPTGAPPVPVPGATFSQVSLTPDGRHLVFTDWLANQVSSFVIADDASLTRVGDPLATGEKPVMPVFTPDGRHVYVSNEISGSVSGYAIAEDGRLTPTPGSPYPAVGAHGASISPDGRHLYVSDTGGVGGFVIGPRGELTALPGSPYPAPGSRTVLSPDGSRLFALDGLSSVRTLVRRQDGTLAPSGMPAASTGVLFSDGQIAAITPNVGPEAALRIVDRQGPAVTLSAAGSTDPDGRVATYVWDFGDGTRTTTTDPVVSHRYDRAGVRSVTVTVSDDEGCSTQLIYTGTTATCSGGAGATARLTFR